MCDRLIKRTFKRVHHNLPRNLTSYLGPTQCSAVHCLNVKGKWQKKIFNLLGISCGEIRKQSKFLTHNPLIQRGLTELMMLDIFCCLSYSTSPISATLPYDSETRPEKWEERNASGEETIYTWGHWQWPSPCLSLFCTESTGSTVPQQALPGYAVVSHQPQPQSPSSSHCQDSGLPGTSSPALLAALEMIQCPKRERWEVCDKKTRKKKVNKRGKQKKKRTFLLYLQIHK